MKTLPGIFKQEKESLALYLDILFSIYETKEEFKEEIYKLSEEILDEALNKDKLSDDRSEEVVALYPVIAGILLPGLSKDLKNVIKRMGAKIVNLINVDDPNIREEVRKMMIIAIEYIN